MKKVVKFGGSSLASAEQFVKVGNIIHSDDDRKFVVPSAPGKRSDNDTKVTDMLYACYELAEKDHNFNAEMAQIEKRYQEIIDGLKLELDLSAEFDKIIDDFKRKAGPNYAASRGEYLNGLIMANYLGYEFVDPAEAIRFNASGVFDAGLTQKLLSKRLENVERAVIPGFYGAKEDGTVVTFSRGGSDITGSIVAKAIQADVYENWTDVSGILIADPRIIENPKGIDIITYGELRELSYMGFNVLHEDA
ncbi:MAG: aspartate kinase, partial [Lachnospiraceae bacterium]|nr:aspartate kinase [Lachnospiraceae bacterium]